jgi:hypothetical protein
MALPHPQSRKDDSGKEDKPSCGGVVWKFFKRTINITEYRNAKDDVNPAENRTFGGIIHDWFLGPALLGGGLASIGPADGEAATQEFSIGAGSGKA